MDIVLFSTADWDNPFWTNKQHVAVELAKLNHRVFYIDSIGLRQPTATKRDIKRIIQKLLKIFSPPKKVKENIWVFSPVLLPFHKYSMVRILNKLVFQISIKFWKKRLNFSNDLLWTYNPLTTNLLNIKTYKKTLYHCVDDIQKQPNMPIHAIETGEKHLLKNSFITFVTSKKLYKDKKKYSNNIHLHSNVADFSHFNQALEKNTIVPKELKNIPGFKIMFIGAISEYKVDFDLLEYIAQKRPNYSIVLIGDIGEGDPNTNTIKLKNYKNIYFLGPKNYSHLPAFLKGANLTILPSIINDYTRSMFPMKFFEYLSAGKQIVSTNLPALEDFRDICYLCTNYNTFLSSLDKVCKEKEDEHLNKRLEISKKYSYSKRTKDMLKMLIDK